MSSNPSFEHVMNYLAYMNAMCQENLGLALWYLEGWETLYYMEKETV
jgi:hypothetical protein